jgi:uncharacterized protein (TIGR02145 family)
MKRLLFLIIIFCALKTNAQDYNITFAGTGLSTVKVENLTAGTILTINGSDILRLTAATVVNAIKDNISSELKMYPNPMADNSTMEIFPPVAGNAIISVLDMTGKQVAKVQSHLENLRQDFIISGLRTGFYLVNVRGNNYQFSGKLLSNGKSNGVICIEKVNNITQAAEQKVEETESKGNQATVNMAYTDGDRLKFTGISGNYSTVKIDIPTSNKEINFNFFECNDGDNNNYPVVEINTQIWMAENLGTTKYNDGTTIPLVVDNTEWSSLDSPGYCWYNNDEAGFKSIYGALYNWFAVVQGNICPSGWHVPTVDEWIILTNYLGSTPGSKMKETGTSHWNSPNTGASNESGFTALPGGGRSGINGSFTEIGNYGYFSSFTEVDALNANGRCMVYNATYVANLLGVKKNGWSVRCLRGY